MDPASISIEISLRVIPLRANVLHAASTFAMTTAGPPPDRGVAIVCAGIRDRLSRIVVRPETRRLRVRAERKLENGHAGKPELVSEGFHFGRDDSQIFRHQR